MPPSPPEIIAGIIEHNTGVPQPDSMERVRVKLIAVAHGPLTVETFDAAFAEALDQGLIRETDGRYALSTDSLSAE